MVAPAGPQTWIRTEVEALNLREQMNPIRKIVTLLQDMQKEIEADGEKEQKAYDKSALAPGRASR